MRVKAFGLMSIMGVAVASPAASATAPLELAAGMRLTVEVTTPIAIPDFTHLPASRQPGNYLAYTLRSSAGDVVGGTAALSLPGLKEAASIPLSSVTGTKLTRGRYTLTVSGTDTKPGSTASR